MANASVSGLASGLDTATIIDQLMQLEAAPQTRLKSRVTTEKSTPQGPPGPQHQVRRPGHQGRGPGEGHGLDADHGHQLQRQGHRQGHVGHLGRRALLHGRHHGPGPPARLHRQPLP